MGFRLTRAAEDDLVAIGEAGIRLFGHRQARRYHDELFARFALLAANPRMARERQEISPPVRIHPFKTHLVVYLVEDADILILRIRHAHEDWQSEA